VLDKLAVMNETEVFEEYLIRRWGEIQDDIGPPPEGPAAVAVMRLVIQAQDVDKQQSIIRSFAALPREDQRILAEEMCRTGLPNQQYQLSPIEKRGGPSVLVYYSPAFVRKLTPEHARDALRLLAEVYRRARSLWPLKPEGADEDTVTVRIDQIKELNLLDIQSIYAGGESWCLSRRNAKEGVIERQPLDVLAKSLEQDTYKVLKFWRVMSETKTEDDFYKNSMQRHVMHAVGRALTQQLRVDKDDDIGDATESFGQSSEHSGHSTPNSKNSGSKATPKDTPRARRDSMRKRRSSVEFMAAAAGRKSDEERIQESMNQVRAGSSSIRASEGKRISTPQEELQQKNMQAARDATRKASFKSDAVAAPAEAEQKNPLKGFLGLFMRDDPMSA